MKDKLGREISYLRLSVTQRCNLNCLYCGAQCPDTDELSVDEIKKAVECFAECGINKVRLTGGEPLVRSDIAEIAAAVSSVNGIEKTVLTTNGVLLSQYAKELKEAGVGTVNVSIDTLDRENYKRLTGADCLDRVLAGLDEAESAGLKIRVNAVLIRGENDREADLLIDLARKRKIDVRFIELMPFSDTGKNKELIIRGDELLKRFDFLKSAPSKCPESEPSVARYFTAAGFAGRVGLITPVSEGFCDKCNRIRLLSNGEIKPCLGHDETYPLRPFFGDKEKMLAVIKEAIYSKPKGHEFNCGYGSAHAMNKIGG